MGTKKVGADMTTNSRQALAETIMKILGSSINFKGLADEWFIKHTEDTEQILSLVDQYVAGEVTEARLKQHERTSDMFVYENAAITYKRLDRETKSLNERKP